VAFTVFLILKILPEKVKFPRVFKVTPGDMFFLDPGKKPGRTGRVI
jgi:hypothetical protein